MTLEKDDNHYVLELENGENHNVLETISKKVCIKKNLEICSVHPYIPHLV